MECEALHAAARLGPYCGRQSRGILLQPEGIVSTYSFEEPVLRVQRVTHVPSQAVKV